MSVDTATVRHIAKLARIAVSDAEADALVPELNNILGWVEQLQEVDVSGIEPMTAVIPNELRMRKDVVTDGGKRDDVLANAPVIPPAWTYPVRVIVPSRRRSQLSPDGWTWSGRRSSKPRQDRGHGETIAIG